LAVGEKFCEFRARLLSLRNRIDELRGRQLSSSPPPVKMLGKIRLAGGAVARGHGPLRFRVSSEKLSAGQLSCICWPYRLQDSNRKRLDINPDTFNELTRAAAVGARLDRDAVRRHVRSFAIHLNRRVMEKKRSAVLLR
jgi:hypothetical protein